MGTRHIFFDGTKSLDLPQYPDSAWTFYDNPPDLKDNELYSSVAAVFRAANLTANATANIPFALVDDETGEDYDTSSAWKNRIGFLPDLIELLRLWRLSLIMTNSAYGFLEGRRVGRRLVAGTNLRYIVPSTITPQVDEQNGLTGFKRSLGGRTEVYQDIQSGGNIFYMWRLDHTTELLPSKHTELRAMCNAAGILYYADVFVKEFFERRGIKPTMLMVKGVTNRDDRERIENIWDKVVRGMYKYLGKIFNAEMITPIVIGDGIDNLKDENISKNKLADVAMAIGMPLSLLLANSANYATAAQEYQSWYRDEILPWCAFMTGCLNKQIFNPLGLRFEFRPEQTELGQEEEVRRAGAFQAYVASGIRPSLAAQIVGIDLPAGVEYAELDEAYQMTGEQPQSTEAESTEEQGVEEDTELKQDLRRWKKKAIKAVRAGKSACVEFTSDIIPDDVRQFIERKLADALDEYDVRKAFILSNEKVTEGEPDTKSEILRLAEAINEAAKEAREETEEEMKPQTADTERLTDALLALVNQLSAQGQPVIQVNVPETPAPVINIQLPDAEGVKR